MTYSDASNYFSAMSQRRQIAEDTELSLLDKSRQLMNWQIAAETKPEREEHPITLKNVFHGLIGAGIGLGAARLAGKHYNIDPSLQSKLDIVAMGAGAAMNAGILKSAEERKHAFRLGFVRGLHDAGYFVTSSVTPKEAAENDSAEEVEHLFKNAAFLPIPLLTFDVAEMASGIPKSIARAIGSPARTVGTLTGAAEAVDEGDREVATLQAEKALLDEQLEKVKALKRNRVLRQVLAKTR